METKQNKKKVTLVTVHVSDWIILFKPFQEWKAPGKKVVPNSHTYSVWYLHSITHSDFTQSISSVEEDSCVWNTTLLSTFDLFPVLKLFTLVRIVSLLNTRTAWKIDIKRNGKKNNNDITGTKNEWKKKPNNVLDFCLREGSIGGIITRSTPVNSRHYRHVIWEEGLLLPLKN